MYVLQSQALREGGRERGRGREKEGGRGRKKERDKGKGGREGGEERKGGTVRERDGGMERLTLYPTRYTYSRVACLTFVVDVCVRSMINFSVYAFNLTSAMPHLLLH